MPDSLPHDVSQILPGLAAEDCVETPADGIDLSIFRLLRGMPLSLSRSLILSATPEQVNGLATEHSEANWVGAPLEKLLIYLCESQQYLTQLINSLPGIVFSSENDSDWSMRYLSEGCLKLTGYASNELVGANRLVTYNDITHPDDLPGVLQAIDAAIAHQHPYVVEYRIRTKSGEEKWLWEKGYGVTDQNHNVLGLEGFITDITDRKQAEAALQRVNAKYAALVEQSPAIIYTAEVGRAGVWSYISPQIQSILGFSVEEWLGHPERWFQQLHPEDRERVLQDEAQSQATGNPFRSEYRLLSREGQVLWVRDEAVILPCEAGEPLLRQGVMVDISEAKRGEVEREHTERALEEKEAFLRLVLDNIPQHIFWKDQDLVYRGGNKIWAQHLGFATPEQLVGKTDYDLWQTDKAEDYRQRDRQVMSLDQAALHVLRHKHLPNGEEVWQDVSKVPIHDAEGNVIGVLGTMEDITERKRAENALRQAEAKYRSIFENAVEGIFQTTPQGRYLTANPMLARIYGYETPEDLILYLTDIEHQLYVDPQRRVAFTQLMQKHGAVWGFESQIYRKDGSVIWISECARAFYDDEGCLLGYEGTVEDITRRKQDEAELRKRDTLLQGVAEATNCLLANPSLDIAIPEALAILGQAAGADRVYIYENHPHPETGEIAMSNRYEWVQESIAPTLNQCHWQNQPYSSYGMERWYHAFRAGRPIHGLVQDFPGAEQEILQRDGILSILMVPIFVDEQLWGYVGFDDCQTSRYWSASEESILVAIAASIGGAIKRQHTEEKMRHQAFHDALTGLPNRMLFNQRLSQALAYARRTGEHLAVMFLDLDRFKTINDTLGHAVGDQLLCETTRRLTACLREEDTIARWGGDEFTLLLPSLKTTQDAVSVAHRISNVLKPAFYIHQHELHITSSIGIALYPSNGHDAQTLLKNADTALYQVKERGRNNYQFYSADLGFQASELLTLGNSLHHALERHEFVIHYQPQINVKTGEITQMEALLRWQHPQLGLVAPQTFVALAEDNGLIVPIGEWVMREACAQNRAWQVAGFPPLRIAVNLSVRQLQHPGFVDRVARVLQETELEPKFLELEITETAAMRDVNFTTSILHELKAMGVRIALDDFGTGYSSLSYLKQFPLHTLKIDRSFVQDLADNTSDAAIITAMITLGRGLNLNVVAEGVETSEQVEQLRSLHCEEMQGYWFSRPLHAAATLQFLKQHQQSKGYFKD